MECNKDEAEKAMAKAEEKFKSKDVDGAKKFALKAKTLFPSLPGLPQAIAAYEVHIAGNKRKRGETHWCYAVLGADPSENLEAIKQRYKKLCVQIHPDKNRSAAADGAFKLVKEAWDKISESSAEAQSGGAKNTAGPKDRRGSNTATNEPNGPNARRGTRTTNKNSSGGGGASTHRGPTNANGSSHACGGGNNAFGTANARAGYWHWEFSNADGSHHKFHHYYRDGTNTASTNASTGFGSVNVSCPNCGTQAMNLDADGLAIRCYRCNMLGVREKKDGKFRIMLQLGGNVSVQGSNNVSVKILKAKEVVIQGGENINIDKATAVTIKDSENINIDKAFAARIKDSKNININSLDEQRTNINSKGL